MTKRFKSREYYHPTLDSDNRGLPIKFRKPPRVAAWKLDYLGLVRIHKELLGPKAYNISTLGWTHDIR